MDVQLPDGTVIQGVPDGTTRAQLSEKLKANGYDISKLEAPEQRSAAGELGAAALRGARNTANMMREGATALPQLAPLKPAIDAAASYIQQNAQPNLEPTRPEDKALNTFGELAGAGITGGITSGPVKAVAQSILPAVAGTAGEQIAGKPGEIIGAVTAPAAFGALATKARQAIANRVDPKIDMFKDAGTTPSVGQATEFNFIQGFENLLSKFPGGQGIFRKFSENQQKQLGDSASTGVSAEDAGRAIEKGVGGFLTRTKEAWQKLDDAVATKIPKGSAFVPSNTSQALDELTATVAGAEKTTGALVNPKLAEIKTNLSADLEANGGKLPYEALRALRTKVGSMLDDTLTSGVPNGELKKLYGALSKDLEVGANQAGAGREFSRQNDYYRSRMERIEGTLERVLGKTPEETFARFMPKDANQVSTVRATMRSLDPEQRKIVSQAVVDRLGRATPGKQDAAGDIFSPETFLTNWNKMSPGAKQQIFSDPVMRKNMDAIAGVTENLRGGAKVFANPSGSAGAATPYGIGYLLAGGNVATAGTLVGGAMVGAKMLTSPKVVEWLAQYPKVAPEAASMHLARLGQIFNETKDEGLRDELSTFISSVQKKKE